MAKKATSKKSERHYPVVRKLRLAEQTAVVAGGRFMDVARCLSIANRRLYRQSRTYTCKIDLDIGSAHALQGVDVYVLRDSWDTHGAYKFAMENYYNAMREELALGKGADTRWHDFRVKPDFQSDELIVSAARPNSATATMDLVKLPTGDYDYAEVVDAAGVQHSFVLSNASANEYSVLEQWGDRDRVQGDPASASTTMPYADLTEDADEANYDLIRGAGATPPYSTSVSSSAEYGWHKVATMKQDASGALKLSSGFFEAPLGYIVLVSTAFPGGVVSSDELPIMCTVQTGDYKGVKAKPYATLEMTPDMRYKVV